MHSQPVHRDVSGTCDKCGSEFRTKNQFQYSNTEKHSGLSFICDSCTFKSLRYREVLRHRGSVHDKSCPDSTCNVN